MVVFFLLSLAFAIVGKLLLLELRTRFKQFYYMIRKDIIITASLQVVIFLIRSGWNLYLILDEAKFTKL